MENQYFENINIQIEIFSIDEWITPEKGIVEQYKYKWEI